MHMILKEKFRSQLNLCDCHTALPVLRSSGTLNCATLFQVAHLALTGGENTDICTARIMARVLQNDLAKVHFTWAGRSDNKCAFEALKLKNFVIG